MCEQIIKYDCGHLCRRAIPCIEQEPKRRHSITCFVPRPSFSSSSSSESCYHGVLKFERRATLCETCEAQGKSREIYMNSTPRRSRPQRASAPPVATRQRQQLQQHQYQKPGDGREKCTTATKVSPGLSRSNSIPGRLPSHRLRRVRDSGTKSLRSEYNRLESLQGDDGSETRQGDDKPRPEEIVTQDAELDSLIYEYAPSSCGGRPPSSATSFSALLERGRSEQDSPSRSATFRLSRSDSILKKVQKGLYLQRESSDESFVCSSAREVERGEG